MYYETSDVPDFVGDSGGSSGPVPNWCMRRRRASLRTSSRECKKSWITVNWSTVFLGSRLYAVAAMGSSCALPRRCRFCISTTCWYRLYVALHRAEGSVKRRGANSINVCLRVQRILIICAHALITTNHKNAITIFI